MSINFKKERLRQLRCDELDLTQKDFSARIGCTTASLSAYENGSKLPPTSTLINIAKTSHCSVDWLLGIKDEMTYDLKDRPARNYSEYIKRLFSLEDSEIEINVDCECLDGNGMTFLSRRGIAFQDPIIKVFLKSWSKISSLYQDGTIDDTVYNAWKEKVLRDFNHGRILEGDLDYKWFSQNQDKHSKFKSEYDATISALQDTFQQLVDKQAAKLHDIANDPGEM